MKTIELTYPHHLNQSELPRTVAAIGFFDGVHLGHQKVIQTAVDIAHKEKKQSAVISFHPHPSVVLKENVDSVQYISTLDEKRQLLEQLDVDIFYIIKFNKQLSKLEPETFLKCFIHDLKIEHLVAGFDYTFGYKGKGNMNNIHTYSEQSFQTTTIEKINLKQNKISSTRIRRALSEGDMEEVTANLGRHYHTTGIVVKGDQRGREMGFPTANLKISNEKLLPKVGIYAVRVAYQNKIHDAMASLGYNPTFKENELQPTLEVNIFDFNEQIYNETIKIYWYHYVRDEVKFSNMKAIIDQMKQDEINIRHYFKNITS